MAPTNYQPMNKLRGFTLIELMMVIAIVAILTSVAAPSFKSLIQSNTISSSVNTFLADMRYARSESMKRGGNVVMCRSNEPETTQACNGSSGASKGWATGWIIYHDNNSNGAPDANEILRVQSPIASLDTILDEASVPKYRFPFVATGRLALGNATSLQFGGGDFANTVQRVVCINVGGRARIAGDGNKSCSSDQ